MIELHFRLWLESKCELVQDALNPIIYRLVGNSYPYRDMLKNLGFKFDYQLKQWYTYGMDELKKEALHKLGVIVQHRDTEPALVRLVQTGEGWYLHGNTYPMKNVFKSLGFKWDTLKKKWWKPKINKKTWAELDQLGITMPTDITLQ